jgi:hypothetical protein
MRRAAILLANGNDIAAKGVNLEDRDALLAKAIVDLLESEDLSPDELATRLFDKFHQGAEDLQAFRLVVAKILDNLDEPLPETKVNPDSSVVPVSRMVGVTEGPAAPVGMSLHDLYDTALRNRGHSAPHTQKQIALSLSADQKKADLTAVELGQPRMTADRHAQAVSLMMGHPVPSTRIERSAKHKEAMGFFSIESPPQSPSVDVQGSMPPALLEPAEADALRRLAKQLADVAQFGSLPWQLSIRIGQIVQVLTNCATMRTRPSDNVVGDGEMMLAQAKGILGVS